MPQTDVYFYRNEDGSVPVVDWLRELRQSNSPAVERCIKAVERLKQFGHELRRPHADYLRDGIYELRVTSGRVNCRILYFFDGRNAVILANGLTKEKKVPSVDIERAIKRRHVYESNVEIHRHEQELRDV